MTIKTVITTTLLAICLFGSWFCLVWFACKRDYNGKMMWRFLAYAIGLFWMLMVIDDWARGVL